LKFVRGLMYALIDLNWIPQKKKKINLLHGHYPVAQETQQLHLFI